MIQTAGTRSHRRPHIRGPATPAGALVLNVKHLPNPHRRLGVARGRKRIEETKRFLMETCPEKVEKVVSSGRRAIEENRPVVVICLFGRDRSRAIAEMIGDCFHCGRVYYVHRDGPAA